MRPQTFDIEPQLKTDGYSYTVVFAEYQRVRIEQAAEAVGMTPERFVKARTLGKPPTADQWETIGSMLVRFRGEFGDKRPVTAERVRGLCEEAVGFIHSTVMPYTRSARPLTGGWSYDPERVEPFYVVEFSVAEHRQIERAARAVSRVLTPLTSDLLAGEAMTATGYVSSRALGEPPTVKAWRGLFFCLQSLAAEAESSPVVGAERAWQFFEQAGDLVDALTAWDCDPSPPGLYGPE